MAVIRSRAFEIFDFEVRYQLRRPWPWLFFGVLVVFCGMMTRDDALSAMMYEEFLINSPFAVAKTTVFGSVIWLLLAAPIAGEAGARDVASRMYPLLYTTPLCRVDYLGGRFLAALVLNLLVLLSVNVGVLLAVYIPGSVESKLVGPFQAATFVTGFAYITLPTAFVATAVQFAFAIRTGKAMASYAASMLLIFVGFFLAAALLFDAKWGGLLDPVGIRFVVEDMARLWTPIERNTRFITLDGVVLQNRLLWIGIGIATLAICVATFQFAHRAAGVRRWSKTKPVDIQQHRGEVVAIAPVASTVTRASSRDFSVGFRSELRQTREIAWSSFVVLAKSWTGLAMLFAIPLLMIPVLVDQLASGGAQLLPTTPQILREMTASISNELSRWVIVPLLLVFFAGELVWRDREAGMGDIQAALPGSEWPPFIGRFLALGLLLAAFLLMLCVSGMVVQTVLGYTDFEIGLYLTTLLGLQLPEYLLFALLALVIHVIVNEKYIGHLIAVVSYVFVAALAPMLGLEHRLLIFGGAPNWKYTPMLGFGDSLTPWLWFKFYWAMWAVLLAVVARLFWVRSRESSWSARLDWARQRLAGSTRIVIGVAALLVVASGAFIFYNTNVLNSYVTAAEGVKLRADYEKQYGKFESTPQPDIASASLRIEVFAKRRRIEVNGTYKLVNHTKLAIDTIHVAVLNSGVVTGVVTFDRSAELLVDDSVLGHRIYQLGQPLMPGDSTTLAFESHSEQRGFRESGVDGAVSANGAAFSNGALPGIGFQRSRGLVNSGERRDHGLPERPVIASLYSEEGRQPAEGGGGVTFDAVIGTDEDQTGVAPGALRKTWSENGRRYSEFSTSAPIGSEWTFYAGKYAVDEATWTPTGSAASPVAIRIYHDARHTGHIERVIKSVRASLDYYSRAFGKYPYNHLTVVEVPGAPGTGLHAEASFVSHGEAFSSWVPNDSTSFDFRYAVIAHEMGHQWTLPYAFVEGAPFLSEGLAWYSAIQAVRASRGETEFRRLLARMREPVPYAPIRRGEPLLRALDPYLSYRRGPFAMVALGEYIGVDTVNLAIRRLVERSEQPDAQRVTTLDLYRELNAVTPDSTKGLLHDLFEINAYWQLDTERATTSRNTDGTWQVTLDIRVRKMAYDSAGVESELPMNDLLEIGAFGSEKSGDDQLSVPLHVERRRLSTGKHTITFRVASEPTYAGVDPYHWMIDGPRDNRARLVRVVRVEK